jgi:hypothetical protein
MLKTIQKLVLFQLFNVFISLSAQEPLEITFTDKNSPLTIKYKQLYNNPFNLPLIHFGATLGAFNYFNPIEESSSYSIGLNAGLNLNKKLSFDARAITLIPESIIDVNYEYFGEPLYKKMLQYDITAHYNVFAHTKTKDKMITLTQHFDGTTRTKFNGKVPKKFADHLSLDLGINKFNYYDNTNLVYDEISSSLVKITKVANAALTSAKVGLSFARYESLKYVVFGDIEATAKIKRVYGYFTYLINNKFDVVNYDDNDSRGRENILKDNSNTYQPQNINSTGFRFGYENKTFFYGKPNVFVTYGFEVGALPSLQFFNNSKLANKIFMFNFGFGLCSKVKENQ